MMRVMGMEVREHGSCAVETAGTNHPAPLTIVSTFPSPPLLSLCFPLCFLWWFLLWKDTHVYHIRLSK
jgi:hypothetical protein